jgi:hypothetical protein
MATGAGTTHMPDITRRKKLKMNGLTQQVAAAG